MHAKKKNIEKFDLLPTLRATGFRQTIFVQVFYFEDSKTHSFNERDARFCADNLAVQVGFVVSHGK